MDKNEYFTRQILLDAFTPSVMDTLKNSRVLVVGAGGVGSPFLTYISGQGVGNITIIDGDVVSESNLARQVLYSLADIGKKKVECASREITSANPFVNAASISDRVTYDNAYKYIHNETQPYDLVADCSDNEETRHILNIAVSEENRVRMQREAKPLWLLTVCAEGWQVQLVASTPGYGTVPCRECLFKGVSSSPNKGPKPIIACAAGMSGVVASSMATQILMGTQKDPMFVIGDVRRPSLTPLPVRSAKLAGCKGCCPDEQKK